MLHVIVILGLMGSLWIVAICATFQEEQEAGQVAPHDSEKAA